MLFVVIIVMMTVDAAMGLEYAMLDVFEESLCAVY